MSCASCLTGRLFKPQHGIKLVRDADPRMLSIPCMITVLGSLLGCRHSPHVSVYHGLVDVDELDVAVASLATLSCLLARFLDVPVASIVCLALSLASCICTATGNMRLPKVLHFMQLVVGLDGAGKTSLVASLQRKPVLEPSPTLGFSQPAVVRCNGAVVTLYDVGGGSSIRDIWPAYYAEAHAIIFVLDQSDRSRFGEAAEAFKHVVEHPWSRGKTVLLFGNKCDISDRCSPASILEGFLVPDTPYASFCDPPCTP